MELLELFVVLLLGAVCGAIGQLIGGAARRGPVSFVALGLIGALLGAWAQRTLQLTELVPVAVGDTQFPVLWGILGAAAFAVLIALVARAGGRSRREPA